MSERYVCRFTQEEMADSAGRAYRAALLGLHCPLDPEPEAALMAAASALRQAWDTPQGAVLEGLTMADLGAWLFRAWAEPASYPHRWADLGVDKNLAWEVVARHLAMMLDDEEEELPNLLQVEAQWEGWARDYRARRVLLVPPTKESA